MPFRPAICKSVFGHRMHRRPANRRQKERGPGASRPLAGVQGVEPPGLAYFLSPWPKPANALTGRRRITRESAAVMTRSDMDRVQTYLRRLLGSDRIRVVAPAKPGLTVEVAVDDEVIGTLYEDREEGELSYSVHLTILEDDLPPVAKAAPAAPLTKPRRTR